MGRGKSKGRARPQGAAPASPEHEAADAPVDAGAGLESEAWVDGDEAPLDAPDPGGDSEAEMQPAAEGDPAADAVPASSESDTAPAVDQWPPAASDQAEACQEPAAAHAAPPPVMPTLRRGHVRARVRGPGTLMATGYALTGEQRSRWQAGDEGQFHRGDVASLPDHFEELP